MFHVVVQNTDRGRKDQSNGVLVSLCDYAVENVGGNFIGCSLK